MRKYTAAALVAALGLLSPTAPQAQSTGVATTRSHVEFLASERLEGREAGSQGERLAAEYLAAQLARIGARPLPGRTNVVLTSDPDDLERLFAAARTAVKLIAI